ncbi:MAG: DUF4115 domain-containing protein [Gammaproteobacteria bacterium]|nr:DUF4115 domain-containing protein [Gammaproteobacteria bacterium]
MSDSPEQLQEEKELPTMEQFSALLKKTRESKEISLEKVASDLRLNSALIQALENSDSENLPSKIFVMGYLRSYARLLGVDESGLEQIDLSAIQSSVDVKTNLAGPSETTSKHLSVRLVTYLIVIGIASLLGAWWFSMQSDISKIMAVDEYQQQNESVSNDSFALPEQSGDAEESPALAPEPEVSADSDSDEADQSPVTVVAAPADDVAANDSAVEEVAAEPQVEPVAQSELTITYLDDSWTEVSDADESRLLYGLYKKGREIVLQGVAPFTLFFGFAPGVIVTHNEEQIDHTAFHKNGVARFKVGKAEDNHLPNEN